MTILEGQIMQEMAYVMLFHAEITSKHYKTREISTACESDKDGSTIYRPFTEAEKLDDHVQTMKRHIHRMGDLVEMLEPSSQ